MKIHKLLQLLKDNSDETTAPINPQESEDGLHLYVYDIIDSWSGFRAVDLIQSLTAAAGKDVHIHYNSPGGDIFEGRAMQAAIASYPGKICTHIDGVCASAATYPALSAAEVSISVGALLMIHNSWTMSMGDCRSMRQTADLLEKLDGTIAADYCRRSGKPADQISSWMDAETWFTAEEALAEGFVDRIDPGSQTRGQSSKRWNLSAYTNAPKTPNPENPEPDLSAQIAAQLQHNRNRLRLLDQV